MKNSVLILGIALVSFSTINAKNAALLSKKTFQNIIFSEDTAQINNIAKFEKPSLDLEIFHAETVITVNPKTIKEIILEGDKIIENTASDDLEFMEYEESMRKIVAQSDLIIESTATDEIYPLDTARTLYDEIADMELIIESKVTNELQPLDFRKINSNSIMYNSMNAEKFLGLN